MATVKAMEAESLANHSTSKTRVLIVDDSLDTSTTMATLFELLGFQTRTAVSGVIALGSYLNFRPHAQQEQEVKAMDAGANYYFVKPVEFTKLVELVKQHIR